MKLLKEGKDIPAELTERIQASKAKAETALPQPSAQAPSSDGTAASQMDLLKAKVPLFSIKFGACGCMFVG